MSFAPPLPPSGRIRACRPAPSGDTPPEGDEPLLARFVFGLPASGQARRAELLRRLEAALRAERVRGTARHRGYDVVRHARLVRLVAEVRRGSLVP